MSNLGYGGKPMFYCLVVLPPLLFVNLFNAQLVVEDLWLRAFIAEVVVVVILHGVLWLLIYPGLDAVVELFWPR